MRTQLLPPSAPEPHSISFEPLQTRPDDSSVEINDIYIVVKSAISYFDRMLYFYLVKKRPSNKYLIYINRVIRIVKLPLILHCLMV